MKTLTKIALIIVISFAFSCNQIDLNNQNSNQVEMEEFQYNNPDFSSGVMTPEILWSFGRIGETQLSPDKTKVLYAVSYYSIAQNRSKREIYIINLADNSTIQLTDNDFNEYSPVWRPDGKKIGFLADKEGIMQVWEMNIDGTDAQAITNEESSISNFVYSSTMNRILFTKDVKIRQTIHDIYEDLPEANAMIITDLMFRHWDKWEDENFSHIFVADYNADNSEVTNVEDIMPNEPYDTPTKPFGGVEEIAFSPDGNSIAYSCKKLEGAKYAFSTNSDIYLYDIVNKNTTNISESNVGYDKNPVFSNTGNKIAWESMERDGFEADKVRIFVYDFASKSITDYSENFDQNASQFAWSEDDAKLYFLSGIKATVQLFCLDFASKEISQITTGVHDFTNFGLANDFVIANKMSMSSPIEIFKVDIKSGEETQISFVNKEILDKITFGKVEERWITTTDNKQMLTWIIYPPNFDPNKKYPTLLYCQGGPQSAVSQFFSYRWNFQMMAANDYIIVAPNRRGLPSFGQEWNDQISKDYGGQNMQDYLSAIDEMAKEDFVDEDRLGAIGASYGGLSIFWLAGNHEGRFKTFIAHDGIFDFTSMYGSTEELFFVDWDLGGPYWNPTEKNSYSASPHLFVQNWDTPIMIVQGGKDFRVPETQAFEAFTAAKSMGLEAELLHFPEENHWVLSPQNGILWQREFYKWLDKYLK